MQLEILLVLACCVVLGGAIGFNRAKSFKDALARTKRSVTDENGNGLLKPRLNFQKVIPAHEIRGRMHESITLECHAAGTPPPTVHWLRNNEKINQGPNEYDDGTVEKESNRGVPILGVSSTRSKLFIDCLLHEDVGEYTCVAETPFHKISTTTKLFVSALDTDTEETETYSACFGEQMVDDKPARIIMWSGNRIEIEGANVQLFCRASGSPKPQIKWIGIEDQTIEDSEKFQLLSNGDLLIRNINWEQDMGSFKCVAENEFGTDSINTFLYPTWNDPK